MMRTLLTRTVSVRVQVKEVMYREFTKTGELVESIDLDTFIRLYINHRPVLELDKQDIDKVGQA